MRNMKSNLGLLAVVIPGLALAVAGCAQLTSALTSAAKTPEGQLFCAINNGGGATIVAAITTTDTQGNPVAVMAENAAQAYVQAACQAAATATGAKVGIPVSPAANAASVSVPLAALPAVAK